MKTVALYRRTLTKYFPSAQPNFVSLEGFVDAMVLVEGLKKAGKDLTREGLIRGIESIHDLDLGLGPQLKLNYSAKEHKGFDHVLPTVVRGGGAAPFRSRTGPPPPQSKPSPCDGAYLCGEDKLTWSLGAISLLDQQHWPQPRELLVSIGLSSGV